MTPLTTAEIEAILTDSDFNMRSPTIKALAREVLRRREAIEAKDAEIERLRGDVQVLKDAAKTAFNNLLAQQSGGRLLRRDTVIAVLEAALAQPGATP